MTRLVIVALILVVAGALAMGLAITRRQRLREVVQQKGNRLLVAALIILVVAFAMLMVVNNR